MPRELRIAMLVVGVAVAGVAAVAIPARATYGARLTADEPQYLLSALSLAEDRDLDIADELDDERYRAFHEVRLPVQTEPSASGREVSPHDPLLPAVLAVPMGLGGWAAAKAVLAVLAGVLAAATLWVAVRRFDVGVRVAAATIGVLGVSSPLVAYGSQVYPELPAALAVVVAVGALTGPLDRRGAVALGVAVVALPWLGVKYALVAAALAVTGVLLVWRRGDRSDAMRLVVGLALAGVVYVVAHRVLYGGWTVYAAGDHFVDGELTVVGDDPHYFGRTRRLIGLLLDRGFGLAAWTPLWLLAVPALAAIARRRPRGWLTLAAPLAAGWVTATWMALTMHGWWWPGRQVVVVLPCMAIAMACWLDRARAPVRALAGMLAAAGVVAWCWLLVEVLGRERTLIVDFEGTRNPVYRAWRAVLPDYRDPSTATWWLQGAWLVVLGVAAVWSWRSAAADAPLASSVSSPDQRRAIHVHT